MRIATWTQTQNVVNDHVLLHSLPPDYNTIDKLSRLDGPILKGVAEKGYYYANVKAQRSVKDFTHPTRQG